MLSNDHEQDYEEEVVEDEEDPRSTSRPNGSSGSNTGAALGTSSIQRSSVSSQAQNAPLLASNQIRSSMQHTAPLNQSDLIARSMNQNRPVNAMSSRTTPQNLSSAQYMASRQAGMGPVGQPSGARSMVNRSTVASSRSAYASQSKDGVDPGTSRMRHWVIVFGLLILICLAVAAVVVPLYVKPQYNTVGPPQPVGTQSPTPSPNGGNVSPSADAPSEASGQPTTESFGSFVKDFAQEISGSSVFKDPTSPQYKAVEFIANDANYTSTITDEATMGDFYAVTVFYYSTGGDYWFECSQGSDNCPGGESWLTSDVTYCDWNWISCNDAGRVVDIIFGDAQGNNLTGTLTSELSLLTELRQFVALNGNIEGTLPPKLGDLTSVTHFILSNNSISGEISEDFLENSPMEVFMVSDNNFRGEIPRSLTKMSSIYQMFLDNNRFSGSIPADLGSLPNLASLDLTGNRLSGEIPDSIYSSSIQNLYLGGSTKLQGSISSAIGQATNLVRLHITGTKISDSIPYELFTLPFLTDVVLSNNTLTGELPASVANIGGTLRTLMLDGNKFSGNLPNVAIDDLTISNILTFDRNSFTGAISPTTCRRKGDGRNDLQVIAVDCEEVTCSCCNNCPL